uniref:BPTI/Kunitz inhibitor domain-containing protein n=1 Tax=Spermophilus dauricus TaxID=99837 RepID=A0A8C9PBG2_SPEDA
MKPEWIRFSPWLFVFSMLLHTLSGDLVPKDTKKYLCYSGALGVRPDYCNYPPKRGTCKWSFVRYYYSTVTKLCEPFVFSGCGGNRNNFQQKYLCESYCVAEKK